MWRSHACAGAGRPNHEADRRKAVSDLSRTASGPAVRSVLQRYKFTKEEYPAFRVGDATGDIKIEDQEKLLSSGWVSHHQIGKQGPARGIGDRVLRQRRIKVYLSDNIKIVGRRGVNLRRSVLINDLYFNLFGDRIGNGPDPSV